MMSSLKTLPVTVAMVLLLFASVNAGNTDPTACSLPAGVSSNWWATVQKNIRDSEYHITWQAPTALSDLPAAWQAPNRSHNLRTYFTDTGIRVIPRAEKEPSWQSIGIFFKSITLNQGEKDK